MRRFIPTFALALLCALGPFLGAARADLRFREPAVDLGRIRSGIPLAHRFSFTCAAPAQITDIRTSCGCLGPRLARRAYQAGEEGAIDIELNTLSQSPGHHVWPVRVFYQSGGGTYEMELQIKAEVVREVLVEPGALAITADRAIQREIAIRDLRPRPFLITAVQASSPALSPRLEPPARDADGRWLCKVVLDILPVGPDGRRDEVLSIFTNDPDYRELRVPVTLIKRSSQEIHVSPRELSIQSAAGQPIPSQRLLVRRRDGLPVQIDKVETSDSLLQVRWAQGAHGAATVKVKVESDRLGPGDFKATIHIHVSQPAPDVILVPVTVRIQ